MQSSKSLTGKRRALVIGGSIAGLATALHLRRAGWRVDVFERTSAPLAGRGAGIMTHPELRHALAALGVETLAGFGVDIAERILLGRDDAVTATLQFPQVSASWAAVHGGLARQLADTSVERGADLVGIEQQAGAVVAHFRDGRSEMADLLVGADGVRSTVRTFVAEGVEPDYAGYIAWRGMAPEAAIAVGPNAKRAEAFTFCLPPSEQMLGYLVPGPGDSVKVGERSYNFVWYRPADREQDLPRLLTDAHGVQHRQSIPPDRIAPSLVAAMRADAARLLAPWFQRVVVAVEHPFLQPLYDVTVPALSSDRVALVGDAGFTIRPHVGGGVLKAVDDAAALARTLATYPNVPHALKAYSAERSPVGHAMVAKARALGSYIKSTYATQEEQAEAARHAEPDAVLRETANLQFLETLRRGRPAL